MTDEEAIAAIRAILDSWNDRPGDKIHWIDYGDKYECSNCGWESNYLLQKCPNCKKHMINGGTPKLPDSAGWNKIDEGKPKELEEGAAWSDEILIAGMNGMFQVCRYAPEPNVWLNTITHERIPESDILGWKKIRINWDYMLQGREKKS